MAGEARLADLCDAIVDCHHSTPVWTDSGAVVLRSQNIRNGRLHLSAPSYTDEAHFAERTRRAVPTEGDLVITREAPMGEVCMIPPGLRCCLGQRMVLLRPDRGRAEPRYLLYALQSKAVQHEIGVNEGTGSTVSNLRIPLVAALPIPMRTLPEQRAIAHILGTLDDKIELNLRMNETLEAMARALFKSWFVDFDPVRAKADGRDPGLTKPLADLFPDSFEDSELGQVPAGWPCVRLGEHVEASKGVGYNSAGLGAAGSERLHNLNSIKEGGGYKYGGLKFWAGRHNEQHRVQDGDVLVASVEQGHHRRLIGFAAQVPSGMAGLASQDLFIARPRTDRVTREFVAHLINGHLQPAVSSYATGTTVNHLPVGALDDRLFTLPPQALVTRMVVLLSNSRAMQECLHRQSQTLAVLRDALLPELISGELRVDDATRAAEDGV